MIDQNDIAINFTKTRHCKTNELWKNVELFTGGLTLSTHNIAKQTFTCYLMASVLVLLRSSFLLGYAISSKFKDFIIGCIRQDNFYNITFDDVHVQRVMLHEIKFIKAEPLIINIECKWDLSPHQCYDITSSRCLSILLHKISLQRAQSNVDKIIRNHIITLSNGLIQANIEGSPPVFMQKGGWIE